MELYVVFPNDPPEEWLGVPGVKAVSVKELGSIEDKLVVVGDCQLAERLKVACLTEEEAEELLKEKVYPHPGQ